MPLLRSLGRRRDAGGYKHSVPPGLPQTASKSQTVSADALPLRVPGGVDMPSRLLKQSEIDLARQVFRDQLPYDKVHIASYYLPGNQGVPVTMASASSLLPFLSSRHYTIYFGPDVFEGGADQPGVRDTFLHVLTP